MEMTLESLQALLADLSSFIQVFILLLGTLLIIVPLMVSFPFYHGQSLISSTKTITRRLGLHHLYKRICHYSHLWILILSEELGLFGLLDTMVYWFSSTSSTLSTDRQQQYQYHHVVADSLKGGNSLNHHLANVCIRSPMSKHEYPLIVSGLVNTGNTCFLNSVLQALSSLPRLQVYLDRMNQQYAHQHLPVTRSLFRTLRLLSRPLDEQHTNTLSFRPVEIVAAINANHRVINREQQDAHELFQLLSGAMEAEEAAAVNDRDLGNGLKDLLTSSSPSSSPSSSSSSSPWSAIVSPSRFAISGKSELQRQLLLSRRQQQQEHLHNPFTGLLANRLSCSRCGYTEAIRHFSFNNIQLTLPQTLSTTLHECLEQMTTMEYLDDASCKRCSMLDFIGRLGEETERLKHLAQESKDTKTRRETLSTLVQIEMLRRELDHRLSIGTIEDDYLRKHSQFIPYRLKYGKSTKQAMFAKPPKVLCLHISRSAFHPSGVIYKNKCQLEFPEYLDMEQFCTNGTLSTSPDRPISQTASNQHLQEQQRQQQKGQVQGVKYKLMSIIVHYGSHNYGHFIAYKRRVISDGCGCHQCQSKPEDCLLRGKETWYRISDENVDICSIDEVLLANPYMLLYESVDPPLVTKSYSTPTLIPSSTRVTATVSTTTPCSSAEVYPETLLDESARAVLQRLKSDEMKDDRLLDARYQSSYSNTPLSMTPSVSTSSSSSSSAFSASSIPLAPSTSSIVNTATTQSSNELLAASASSCGNQKQLLGSSRTVHRNQKRRKMSWEEQSAPPLAIY